MTIDGEAFRSHTAVGANKRLDELDPFCGLVERAQKPSGFGLLYLVEMSERHEAFRRK
ncbi:MAG: hypothetical protein HLX51_13205 [Micrococcaceae bacterium]|nr:hypothetical protein [Micrococcaceae bacterium]